MDLVDLVGWIAGGLVLTAFNLKTMVPLRIVAIAGNIAFVSYGSLAHAVPIVVLHALLLPLNLWRLYELSRPPTGRSRMNSSIPLNPQGELQ